MDIFTIFGLATLAATIGTFVLLGVAVKGLFSMAIAAIHKL